MNTQAMIDLEESLRGVDQMTEANIHAILASVIFVYETKPAGFVERFGTYGLAAVQNLAEGRD